MTNSRPILKLITVAILFLLVAGLIWLSEIVETSSTQLEKALVSTFESILLQRAERFSLQFQDRYVSSDDSFPEIFRHNLEIRKTCDEKLELIYDKNIRFIYLLWMDSSGKFRFLCDGSESKGETMQKFDPDNLSLWQKIYREGTHTIIDQSQFRELWKSLLYPLRDGNRTRAMLVIDYSVDFLHKLQRLISPIRSTLQTILIVIVLFAALIILQFLLIFLIRNRSIRDSLTGTYNRNFLPFLKYMAAMHRYHLLMIDLDYFKRINDTYGHDVGDMALRHCADLLQNITRPTDRLIRYGGEEFLLWSPSRKNDPKEGRNLAQKILETLRANPLKHPLYGEIRIMASIGLFAVPPKKLPFDVVLKKADLALYRAKKAGRNGFIEVASDRPVLKEVLPDFSDVKRWIEQEQVVCCYQPIFDRNGTTILKYETLVRLKDDQGRLIMPSRFLDTIWHTNTYIHLTRQVLSKAIQTFRERPKVHFTVNLTLQDLLDEQIVSFIRELAHKEQETVARMGIEILEYHYFENIERLREIITQFKELRISIILDDFGSGHANFFILQYLPIDEFKIDRKIILEALTGSKAKKLLITLAQYARDTGLKTTAEHIANKEIFDMIQTIPVDQLQGFYLGRPTLDPQHPKT
jgi:diguanylate cyclase (GGDEF)-like protein